MEAKDTVIKTTIYNCHNTLEERLQEQAEISFKDGKQAGIKEVVEWMQWYGGLPEWIDMHMPEQWQDKLKEWGIEK